MRTGSRTATNLQLVELPCLPIAFSGCLVVGMGNGAGFTADVESVPCMRMTKDFVSLLPAGVDVASTDSTIDESVMSLGTLPDKLIVLTSKLSQDAEGLA